MTRTGGSGRRVPVLIVGGGSAGLTASILLSRLGIDSLLTERHSSTAHLPKAHILNQRTMEIFREAGLADRVYASGAPLQCMSKTAWYTSFAGPTEWHGREVGFIDSWGGGADTARYDAASPCRVTNLPQHHLEPLMLELARELGPDRLLFGHEVMSLAQSADGVTASVRSRDTGDEWTVEAAYVIAADGGRSIGPMLGIEMEGTQAPVKMVTTHFSADMHDTVPDPSVAIFSFVNPDGPGMVHRGTLIQMGGRGWGRDCTEWVFNFSVPPDDPADFDAAHIGAALRGMLGLADLAIDVHRISTWTIESVVADRYRDGRIFVAGDAAHRHPPAGGLGLNSAVQDVHNLAWKLALVLTGAAGDHLLDTYAEERRPVGTFNAAHAVQSFFQSQLIDRALGYGPDTTPAQAWATIADYFSDTPVGSELRERMAAAIHVKRAAYRAQNVELGYHYDKGAVIGDAGNGPGTGPDCDPVTDYRATTRPGHRVPHAWIDRVGESISTVDLPEGRRFVLIIAPEGASAWVTAAGRVADDLPGVPLDVAVMSSAEGADCRDVDGAWASLAEVGVHGAVLVRPDGHVAWRSAGAPDAPTDLSRALTTILKG